VTPGAAGQMRWREAGLAVLPALVAAKLLTLLAMVVSIEHGAGSVTWGLVGQAFSHWDAISYIDIAGHGYPPHLDYRDAFLPGYPMLIRGLSFVTRDLVLAGVLVSAVAELAALLFIHELVRRERDATVARFAVWGIALAPLGFFLTGVYSESVFIAAAALSLLLMRGGRMRGAALAAALAVAMRLTGIVLLPVLAMELLRQHRTRSDGLWLAIIPLPLLLLAAYMRLRTGDALAFLNAESLPSFGESAAWPWDGLQHTWATAAGGTDLASHSIFIREIVAGLLGFAAVVAAWVDARFPRSMALYCTLVWLMAVSITFWRSVPRYDLALFPIVIVVADLTSRARAVRPLIVAGEGVVLVWGAFIFAEGGWIG
jgi:Gpi18-like mannosyltransferase